MNIQMMIVILIIIFILAEIVVVLIWLLKRRMNVETVEVNEEEIVTKWLMNVMREPNPFSELLSYAELVKLNRAEGGKVHEVVEIFFHHLRSRGAIEEIGPFNAVVPFEPSLHRSSNDIKPGELVRIVKPGWKLNEKILKYPIVQREKKRDN